MKTIARNTLAVVLGWVAGSVVNMALVTLGPYVIPLPEGADVSTMEGIRESMKLFGPVNFIIPFLAHALGTLVGALVAAKLGVSHRMKLALGVGVLFLLGGIAAASMMGGPVWFIACDVLLAYIPMGYLGGVLGARRKPETP